MRCYATDNYRLGATFVRFKAPGNQRINSSVDDAITQRDKWGYVCADDVFGGSGGWGYTPTQKPRRTGTVAPSLYGAPAVVRRTSRGVTSRAWRHRYPLVNLPRPRFLRRAIVRRPLVEIRKTICPTATSLRQRTTAIKCVNFYNPLRAAPRRPARAQWGTWLGALRWRGFVQRIAVGSDGRGQCRTMVDDGGCCWPQTNDENAAALRGQLADNLKTSTKITTFKSKLY